MRAVELDHLPPEVIEAIEDARRRSQERMRPIEALAWLAVVPQWTDQLALALEFPTAEAPLEEVVDRAVRAGLCECRAGRPPAGATFWMPEYVRKSLTQSWPGLSTSMLGATAREIADRMGRLADPSPAAGLELWRQLAEAGPGGAAALLTKRVIALAAHDDTATALEWLTAIEPLALTLRGEVEEALVRGRRRLGLVHRRRLDERALLHHVIRPGAVDALRELISGPDELWAANFVGLGGVGKTMLMRYLSVVLADEIEERPLLVGRVDFDYLDARYPWDRPAELLIALADALTIHARTTRQDSLVDNLVEQVRRLDATYRDSGPVPVRGKAFKPVLDAFQSFVQSLPGRVVLVLDTCEELAKLHGPGEDHTSIDRTFEILEEIHGRVLDLRVVLSGRRLLATAGAGWEYDPSRGRPGSLASLKPRSYLRLHELRSFDERQARELLRGRRRMPEELENAILGASHELGRVAGVPGGGKGPDEDRYNPYDLELFIRWCEETGGKLDAAAIRSGGRDGYVKARIIDRITERELPPALPAVALLGRFDVKMLGAGLPDGADASAAFAALSHQEWIDADIEIDDHAALLQVEPQLLGRLRGWYAHAEPEKLAEAAGRLGAGLAEMVRAADIERLGVERLEVATRCLDVDAIVALWADLPEAIAPLRAWEMVDGAALRLLSEEDPVPALADGAARGAVLSGRATAYLHRGRREDARAAWGEVRRLTDAVRDGPAAALNKRAQTMERVCSGDAPERLPRLPDPVEGEQAVATALAGVEAVLEHGEGAPGLAWPELSPIADWADAVATHFEGPLAAAVRCAHARWAAWCGDRAAAEAAFEDACIRAPAGRTDRAWADWIAPASVADRVMLERMVHAADLGRWLQGPPDVPDLSTTDGDRLAAITLELSRIGGTPSSWPVESLIATVPQIRGDGPSCRAHLRVPPLFVAVARWHVSRGRHEEAVSLLQRIGSRAAGSRGTDSASSVDAEAAGIEELRIARAMRLERGYVQRARREAESAQGRAYAAALAVLALCGPPSSYPLSRPSEEWAWMLARPPQVPPAEGWAPVGPSTVYVSMIGRSELNRIRRASGKPGLTEERSPGTTELVGALREHVARGRADSPVLEPAWLAIAARESVASGATPDISTTLPGLVAAVLTDEAELAGLQAPGLAATVLLHASDLYAKADDPFGEFRAAAAGALCMLRAGDHERAQAILRDRVEPTYASLVGDARWPRLDPAPVSLSKAAGGWLQRVRTAQTWATGAAPWPSADAPAEVLPLPDHAIWRPEPRAWLPRRSAMQIGMFVVLTTAAAVALLVDVEDGIAVLTVGWSVFLVASLYIQFVARLDGRQISIIRAEEHKARLLLGKFVSGEPPEHSKGGGVTVRLPAEGRQSLRLSLFSMNLMVLCRLRKGAVALDVDESLEAEPWEAILMRSVDPRRPDAIADIWRRRHSPREETPPAPATGAIVAGSDRWSRLAEEPWGPDVSSVGPLIMRIKVDTAVLHLIGAPALLNGWHLRLDDELRAYESGTVTKSAADTQLVLAPETLDLTRSPLVIVQGTPGARGEEFARGLRSFAAQMNAAGARAVLVIPGVPPTAAGAAAAAAAKRFRANPQPSRANLIATARDARLAIVHSLDEVPPKDRLRTSLDLCLFLTEPMTPLPD